MIRNQWSDKTAQEWCDAAPQTPADQALALRVYTSRLIGTDPDLVMHGGGNTSAKVQRANLFGEMEDVLHVKGSGWDLEVIEAAGLPGVRLEPLRRLRTLDVLSDEDMVNVQRNNLLDSAAPNPSVETLLHAYLPHTYVDHTHATAFLVLANLPNAAERCREIFGDRLGIVPYIMPGFALAKAAADVYEANPDVEGLLLLQHGHFAFGDTAKKSYDRIVEHTNMAAAAMGLNAPTDIAARDYDAVPDAVMDLRGALARGSGRDAASMPILDVRADCSILEFLQRGDLADLSTRGVASPDHVIRIKGRPLHLPRSVWQQGVTAINDAIASFQQDYKTYFDREAARSPHPKTMLSSLPSLVWMEGVGVIGVGVNATAASIAADIGVQNVRVRAVGEDQGGFHPVNEADLFDLEYWSLEQAKLGRSMPPVMTGKVVMVTGAAGAIGRAIAETFAKAGAQMVLVDRPGAELQDVANTVSKNALAVEMDITEDGAAERAVMAAISRFGGVDILISNAGAAQTGSLLELNDQQLAAAYDLNFFAPYRFARAVAHCLCQQGQGGQLLFNISKQSVNPGLNFGAYGLPKSSTLFLMRQLALELGGDHIRVNGVNADRIRSGIVTDEFIASRAETRGVDEAAYMSGNLLKQEVEPAHVAEAFLMLAQMQRTTGHVVTVDGGNVEASLR